MNVIWIVADTFRPDRLGAYGAEFMHTPTLDTLAPKAVRFEKHYAGGFPTMPTRADHATGRFTMSFMGWEALPAGQDTLALLLADHGVHTAAVVDTPFYFRHGMNYDRGFQSYFPILGQEESATRVLQLGHNESRDIVDWWRKESDRSVARTMTAAGDWLERHCREQFFLYVDTWDPHEPWDAPPYYTELYMPDYDGEIVQPRYAHWHDDPDYTEAMVQKAHATYSGEITMVDTWIGQLLRKVANMGLTEQTAIIFTTDHGFSFGEHDGLFGKMHFARRDDGSMYWHVDADAEWAHSPLYEELVHLPLLISVPGTEPGVYAGHSSVVDVMPTTLDLFEVEAGLGRRQITPPSGARRVDARSGVHDFDDPVRQPRRPSALGRQRVAAAFRGPRDHGDGGGLGPPVLGRPRAVGALPPAERSGTGDERDRAARGDGARTAQPPLEVHAGDGGGRSAGPASDRTTTLTARWRWIDRRPGCPASP